MAAMNLSVEFIGYVTPPLPPPFHNLNVYCAALVEGEEYVGLKVSELAV